MVLSGLTRLLEKSLTLFNTLFVQTPTRLLEIFYMLLLLHIYQRHNRIFEQKLLGQTKEETTNFVACHAICIHSRPKRTYVSSLRQ